MYLVEYTKSITNNPMQSYKQITQPQDEARHLIRKITALNLAIGALLALLSIPALWILAAYAYALHI